MATQSGGGRTREPGEMFNVLLFTTTSLNDAGFVLKHVEQSNVAKVDLCGATDVPYAVNYRSTRDPHSMDEPPGVFKTGTQLGYGIPIFREGWAKLKLATDNAAIEKGDSIVCTGGGKVDKYVAGTLGQGTAGIQDIEDRFDELARIVGHSEEENVAVGTTTGPSQDKILCKLSIRAIGIIT